MDAGTAAVGAGSAPGPPAGRFGQSVPYLVVGTALVLVCGAAVVQQVPVTDLTRDPMATVGAPFYLGVVSHLGVLALVAAAAVSVFAGRLVRPVAHDRTRARFLVGAGALTGVLAVDDLLMLHESALPDYVGFPEPAVYVGYTAAAAWLLSGTWSTLRRARTGRLVGAVVCLAASTAVDVGAADVPLGAVAEDVFKLLGYLFLADFLVRMARDSVGQLMAGEAVAPADSSAVRTGDRLSGSRGGRDGRAARPV